MNNGKRKHGFNERAANSNRSAFADMEWAKREIAEAEANAAAPIADYAKATFFVLEAAARRGDATARAEIISRRGF